MGKCFSDFYTISKFIHKNRYKDRFRCHTKLQHRLQSHTKLQYRSQSHTKLQGRPRSHQKYFKIKADLTQNYKGSFFFFSFLFFSGLLKLQKEKLKVVERKMWKMFYFIFREKRGLAINFFFRERERERKRKREKEKERKRKKRKRERKKRKKGGCRKKSKIPSIPPFSLYSPNLEIVSKNHKKKTKKKGNPQQVPHGQHYGVLSWSIENLPSKKLQNIIRQLCKVSQQTNSSSAKRWKNKKGS